MTILAVGKAQEIWVNNSKFCVARGSGDVFQVYDIGEKKSLSDIKIPPGNCGIIQKDKFQLEIHNSESDNVTFVYLPQNSVLVDKPEIEFACPPGTVTKLYPLTGVLGMSTSQSSSLNLSLKKDHPGIKQYGDKPYVFNVGQRPDVKTVRFKLPGGTNHNGITYIFDKAQGRDKVKLNIGGKHQ